METDAAGTDMGIGMSLLFGLLAVGGALVLLAGELLIGQTVAAAGFGFAMIAAMLAVVVTQIYP